MTEQATPPRASFRSFQESTQDDWMLIMKQRDELEAALASHLKKGKPDILLYRKRGAPSMSLENPEAIQERLDQIKLLDPEMDEAKKKLLKWHLWEKQERRKCRPRCPARQQSAPQRVGTGSP